MAKAFNLSLHLCQEKGDPTDVSIRPATPPWAAVWSLRTSTVWRSGERRPGVGPSQLRREGPGVWQAGLQGAGPLGDSQGPACLQILNFQRASMAWEADELTASFQTVAGEPTRAPLVMPHAYPRVPPTTLLWSHFSAPVRGSTPLPHLEARERPRVHL